jgi:surface protein
MVTITNRKFRSLFGNETTFLLAAKDEPIEYQFDINVNYSFESTWLNSITVTAANQLLLNGATWESRGILEGDEIEITYPDPPPPHGTTTVTVTVLSVAGGLLTHDGSLPIGQVFPNTNGVMSIVPNISVPEAVESQFNLVPNNGANTPQSLIDGELNRLRFNTTALSVGAFVPFQQLGNKSGGTFFDPMFMNYANVFNYATGQAPSLADFEAQIGFPLINGAKFGDTIVFDNVGYVVGDNVFESVDLTGYFKCAAGSIGENSFSFNSIEKVYLTQNFVLTGGSCFESNSITHLFVSFGVLLTPEMFTNNNLEYINIRSVLDIGGSTGDDSVFNGNTGNNVTVIAPAIHQTSNGGGLEGDLAYLQANNTVTFVWDGNEVPEWAIPTNTIQRLPDSNGFNFRVRLTFQNWASFLEADTDIPEWYNGINSIKPFTRNLVYRQLLNPNSFLLNNDSHSNGNVGWYDENFNQGANPFVIQSVTFENEDGDPLSEIAINAATTVKATISGTGTFQDTFLLNFYNLPFSNRYKNKSESWAENVFFTTQLYNFGLNGGLFEISDLTFDNSTPNTLDLEFTITPNSAAQAFFLALPTNDRYFRLSLTTQTANSDRTTLLLWANQAFQVVPIGSVMAEMEDFNIRNHIDQTSRNVFTEDDIHCFGELRLFKASDYNAVKMSVQIVRDSDGVSFDLFQRTINAANYPITPDNKRLFNYFEPLNYNLPNPDRNYIELKYNGAEDSTTYRLDFNFPFIMSWRYWNARPDALADFLDMSLPNNGLNDEWVRYAVAGYTPQVRFEVQKSNVTDFFNLDFISFKTYDVTDVTTVISIEDENGNPLPCLVHGQNCIVKAVHTKATPWDETNTWAWIGARPKETEPRVQNSAEWAWISQNLPLKPQTGETQSTIEFDGNDCIVRSAINAEQYLGNVTLVARVGSPDEMIEPEDELEEPITVVNSNVHKWETISIQLPSQFTAEDRGYSQCAEPRLALADLTDTAKWKNDFLGIALIADSITVELDQNGTILPAFGGNVSLVNQDNAVAYLLDWRDVLFNYGAGCYKVKVNYTLAGFEGYVYWGAYQLYPYSVESSEKTVQIVGQYDDLVKQLGINFTGSGFATTVRVHGFFGDKQINSEHNNILKTDDIRKKVRNFAAPTYQLRTRVATRCITRPIEELLLSASDIWVSDFNKSNHEEYKYWNVILSEDSGIEYDAPDEAPRRGINAVFKDKNWITESKFTNKQGSPPSVDQILNTQCFPATYELTLNGNTVNSGSIPSGQNEVIPIDAFIPPCEDATVQINGDQVATVASGGMVNIAVENESGTPIGTFDEDTGVWVVPNCADGVVTVNRDGVFFATQNVASGGTATVNVPSQEWVRPADWLPMPTVVNTEQTFVGLHAVIEDGDNYVAFRFTTNTGNYQVDWGDGTITTHASNTNAEHQYDFATYDTGNTTLTSRGYKQAMIIVTPVSGDLLTCNFQQRYVTVPAQNQAYSTGFLDCILSMPNANTGSSITFGGVTVRHTYVERVNVLTIGACTSMANMFNNCSSLQSVPLFNTQNVTAMNSMFSNARSLKSVPLFNTQNVTNMSNMFSICSSLHSVPLFNTQNVTNMSIMFNNCFSLQSVPLFNTQNVTNMNNMFNSCSSLQSVPLFNTQNVTDMSAMFASSQSINSIPALSTAAINTDFGVSFASSSNSLNRCQMVFQRTVSFANCQLSRDAIVEIFNNLAVVTTAQTITITGNWGVTALSAADLLIATNKGWVVVQ